MAYHNIGFQWYEEEEKEIYERERRRTEWKEHQDFEKKHEEKKMKMIRDYEKKRTEMLEADRENLANRSNSENRESDIFWQQKEKGTEDREREEGNIPVTERIFRDQRKEEEEEERKEMEKKLEILEQEYQEKKRKIIMDYENKKKRKAEPLKCDRKPVTGSSQPHRPEFQRITSMPEERRVRRISERDTSRSRVKVERRSQERTYYGFDEERRSKSLSSVRDRNNRRSRRNDRTLAESNLPDNNFDMEIASNSACLIYPRMYQEIACNYTVPPNNLLVPLQWPMPPRVPRMTPLTMPPPMLARMPPMRPRMPPPGYQWHQWRSSNSEYRRGK